MSVAEEQRQNLTWSELTFIEDDFFPEYTGQPNNYYLNDFNNTLTILPKEEKENEPNFDIFNLEESSESQTPESFEEPQQQVPNTLEDINENELEFEFSEYEFKEKGSELGNDESWSLGRRPRPGLTLTFEEIELLLNCYEYFYQKHKTKKKTCIEVGAALKIGARKVLEVVQERDLLVQRGAPKNCVPLPRGEKKRGKPREPIFNADYINIIKAEFTSRFHQTGVYPTAKEIQKFLQTLPSSDNVVPHLNLISPGPIGCNLKTLKTYLTKVRKSTQELT